MKSDDGVNFEDYYMNNHKWTGTGANCAKVAYSAPMYELETRAIKIVPLKQTKGRIGARL